MTKPPKRVAKNLGPTDAEIEALDLDPDAWPKFEGLVKAAAKAGHKPHGKKVSAKSAKDE